MNVSGIAKFVPTLIGRSGGRTVLVLKKHSPEILAAAGIIGGVASTVLACRATLKVEDILDEHDEVLETINQVSDTTDEETYSQQDVVKDKAVTYAQTAVKLAKLYAPAVILGVGSIGCVVGSHHILNKRNAALAAAYSLVEGRLKDYRRRVVAELGEDKDKQFYYGLKSESIVEKIKDDEGKTKKIKKNVNVLDPNTVSPYARFFDDSSVNWVNDAERNLMFLRAQQNYANDLLNARGHVFLNEVYDMLGIPRTSAGAIVGWVLDENSDNFVDFGIYSIHLFLIMDAVNGYEPSILLDFNVDGVMYDLIR